MRPWLVVGGEALGKLWRLSVGHQSVGLWSSTWCWAWWAVAQGPALRRKSGHGVEENQGR